MVGRLQGVEPGRLAEGRVLAGLDVAVVLLEGGGQHVGGHVHGAGQVLKGVGRAVGVGVDVDVVLHRLGDATRVERLLIEDDPPLAVACLHGGGCGVVGLALLDEALAVGQHEHERCPVAPGGGVGDVAHQVAVGEGGVHVGHLGAGGRGHLVALAHGAVHEHAHVGPVGQVLVDHLAVVHEAARGEHHRGGLDVHVGPVGVLKAAAHHGAGLVLDEGAGAHLVLELAAQLLELGLQGRQHVGVARADALGRQDDAGGQARQLLVGGGLLELAAEVLDGAVHELGVGVVLVLGPLGIPVVLVEARRLLLGHGLPGLVDGGGEAGVELGLGTVGEHEPARGGAVAAEGPLLLAEGYLLACQGRLHAGGQARKARAHDEDVGLLGEVDGVGAHGVGSGVVGQGRGGQGGA